MVPRMHQVPVAVTWSAHHSVTDCIPSPSWIHLPFFSFSLVKKLRSEEVNFPLILQGNIFDKESPRRARSWAVAAKSSLLFSSRSEKFSPSAFSSFSGQNILTLGTYSKLARENNFLALGVCFPQPCTSAGRRFAASRSRLQNHWRIVPFPQQKFRWNVL